MLIDLQQHHSTKQKRKQKQLQRQAAKQGEMAENVKQHPFRAAQEHSYRPDSNT